MKLSIVNGIETLTADQWNGVAGTGNPFLRHEFLVALERHRCVGERHGWLPRHWGCYQDYHSLHFEACYYQGIDYCIRHGLKTFQPGAQGEHKISRGFLPTPTWSAHWIANEPFRELIARFLDHETRAVHEYIEELGQRSPFREALPA